MMALTQENVHYTLNSGADVMNKSNRVHARIQEFLTGGGGGGGGRGPTPRKQSGQCFFMPPKELWEAYSNRTVRPSVSPSVSPSVPLSCPVHISYIL